MNRNAYISYKLKLTYKRQVYPNGTTNTDLVCGKKLIFALKECKENNATWVEALPSEFSALKAVSNGRRRFLTCVHEQRKQYFIFFFALSTVMTYVHILDF